MESILYSIKHVEFYLMLGAVLVMAGGLAIATVYEFIRAKAGRKPVPTPKAVQELAGGSPTIQL